MMHPRSAGSALVLAASIFATVADRADAGPIPPGRQHLLTIDGSNTVTFVPQAGIPPIPIDYQARIEYIIDTRFGKESKPSTDEGPAEKAVAKTSASSRSKKAKKAEAPSPKISGSVDLSLHSSEISIRQGGQAVMARKISRTQFQGRLQPDSPVMSVGFNEAPPMLQEILKTFDTVSATMTIGEDYQVLNRRYRFEGPQRAVTETILSIHAPIPKGSDTWEAPTQLAMGHGQTAKGRLRFEKVKAAAIRPGEPGPSQGATRPDGPIQVKVSGVLKAEGVVAGRFIKDGAYTVTGEQTYDPHTNEWISSRWSVAVVNELANPAGQTVAHARGTMTVESRALDGRSSTKADGASPKL